MALATAHPDKSRAGWTKHFLAKSKTAEPRRAKSSASKGRGNAYTAIQPKEGQPLQDVTQQAQSREGPGFSARLQAIRANYTAPCEAYTRWKLAVYAARAKQPAREDQPRLAWTSATNSDISQSGVYANLGPNHAGSWRNLSESDFQDREWVVAVLPRANGEEQCSLLKLQSGCLQRAAMQQDADSGGRTIKIGYNWAAEEIGGFSVAHVWVGLKVKGGATLYQPYALLWNPGESKAKPWQIDPKNPYVFFKHDEPTVYQWACSLLKLPDTRTKPLNNGQKRPAAAPSSNSSGSSQSRQKRQLSDSDEETECVQGGMQPSPATTAAALLQDDRAFRRWYESDHEAEAAQALACASKPMAVPAKKRHVGGRSIPVRTQPVMPFAGVQSQSGPFLPMSADVELMQTNLPELPFTTEVGSAASDASHTLLSAGDKPVLSGNHLEDVNRIPDMDADRFFCESLGGQSATTDTLWLCDTPMASGATLQTHQPIRWLDSYADLMGPESGFNMQDKTETFFFSDSVMDSIVERLP